MYKVTLNIDGMSCGMCEAHINDTIRSKFSVKKLKSSWKKGTSEFLAEEAPPEEELREAIGATGYTLTGYRAEPAKKKGLFSF